MYVMTGCLYSRSGFVTAIRKFLSHNQAIAPISLQVSRGIFSLRGIHECTALLGGTARKKGIKIAIFISLGADSASCKTAQQHD